MYLNVTKLYQQPLEYLKGVDIIKAKYAMPRLFKTAA